PHLKELGGEEGVIPVVDHGDGVVFELPPELGEEERRAHAIVGLRVRGPFVEVGLFVLRDLRGDLLEPPSVLRARGAQTLEEAGNDDARVADQTYLRREVSADPRGVDV